ncbi:DUF4019 domain-containing protein [Massilia solisilvae]|uniref:DUF4019 domain-containing protein n=1 Tax=Massilia solisilvae TaxID=1811225 RepID=A0ABT2BH19_9BURK|nr:DUF4019 domain-containing protein [Massilia solisilvae]MCS0607732.1 DUF4019 domain-containing protein [Massilia solisilvae]
MKFRCLFAVAAFAATLAHAQDNNVNEATAAAESWLAQVDKGDVAGSWDNMASVSQKMVSKADWEKSVRGARDPYGKPVSRRLATAVATRALPGAPEGEYVVIQYNTRFNQLPANQIGIETVTPMRDKDGKWRVSGYYIKTVPHNELKD